MRNVLGAVVVAASMTWGSQAAAQVSLDAKLGYALPVGYAQHAGYTTGRALPMSNVWTGAIPIEVAVRYRFDPHLSGGAYFQWNPAFLGSGDGSLGPDCGSGVSCFGYDMRVGLELMYALAPDAAASPWFAIGTGWQWSHYSKSYSGPSIAVTWTGWEYLNLQAGVDFALSRTATLGPYVAFLGGTYTNVSGPPGYEGSVEITARAFHGWFQLGLKGTLNL